jgi:hypothetical protein
VARPVARALPSPGGGVTAYHAGVPNPFRATGPGAFPHPTRLSPDHPLRGEIIARHDMALANGETGYLDPSTGLFVLTAAYLLARGRCCQSGCRHCPYGQ